MKLTFAYAPLRDLLISAEAHWPKGLRERWGGEGDGPGFWLVGDEGVYLMSNAVLNEGEKPIVVYANECNPQTMPFDEWWSAKQASFGGDDGVEFIDAECVRRAVKDESPVVIDITEESMEVFSYAPPSRKDARK